VVAGADVLGVLHGHTARYEGAPVASLCGEIVVPEDIDHQRLEGAGCGGGTEGGF